jgi:hypothetical protein
VVDLARRAALSGRIANSAATVRYFGLVFST